MRRLEVPAVSLTGLPVPFRDEWPWSPLKSKPRLMPSWEPPAPLSFAHTQEEKPLKLFKIVTALSLFAAACLGSAIAADISGAGATFPYPIYAKWADAYKKETGDG